LSHPLKPELRVTAFSDYICPFCYIGSVRLAKLRDEYDLKVNWCLLEIHPDSPSQGGPIDELGYSPKQWEDMMGELGMMAREESIIIRPLAYTTNSRQALLLAEATKEEGADTFYALHRRLFEAYFGEGRNIGEAQVLQTLAAEAGVSPQTVDRAWSEPRYAKRLQHNLRAAQELRVTGVPTYFFIGDRKLTGAVPTEDLRSLAREVCPLP